MDKITKGFFVFCGKFMNPCTSFVTKNPDEEFHIDGLLGNLLDEIVIKN